MNAVRLLLAVLATIMGCVGAFNLMDKATYVSLGMLIMACILVTALFARLLPRQSRSLRDRRGSNLR